MPPAAHAARRADLDWLRVLAFGLLIFYHAGMAWSGWSWHVTSPESLDGLREAMRFLNRWRMPLIFVVSGAAITLALGVVGLCGAWVMRDKKAAKAAKAAGGASEGSYAAL